MQKEPKFLTIAQAAEFLKVSPDTLRRWEAKGLINPQRTKGGSRRYTLLDLKIAKLNKKKGSLFQIPILFTQNYISTKKDLKVAVLTSLLWISGLLAYNFLAPAFLSPANPEHQIFPSELKAQTGLKIASQITKNQLTAIHVTVPVKQPPSKGKIIQTVSKGDDLIREDLPSLDYADTLKSYYSLSPLPAGRQVLPQNDIPTLIKRNLTP